MLLCISFPYNYKDIPLFCTALRISAFLGTITYPVHLFSLLSIPIHEKRKSRQIDTDLLYTTMHLPKVASLLVLLPHVLASGQLSAQDVLSIAPDTANCTSAAYPAECVTATEATPFILLSYAHFNIQSFGAQAALLSVMLYESGSFKYNENHWPGVPGQGTRNMQSPAYNLKYATWLATHVPEVGFTSEDVATANTAGPAAVLGLVSGNESSFGSAAWFLRTQCDVSIEDGLAEATEAGWEAYLTTCVGTTVTADRTAIWTEAIALKSW